MIIIIADLFPSHYPNGRIRGIIAAASCETAKVSQVARLRNSLNCLRRYERHVATKLLQADTRSFLRLGGCVACETKKTNLGVAPGQEAGPEPASQEGLG